MAQFAECFFLDLPHPFAREAVLPADFFKRHFHAGFQPKIEADNLALAFLKRAQCAGDFLFEGISHDQRIGRLLRVIGHQVEEAVFILAAKRRIQRQNALPTGEGLRHLLDWNAQFFGDLFQGSHRRLPGRATRDAPEQIHAVERQAHHAGMFCQGLQNGLANPPDSVRDKLKPSAAIKTLCRGDQPDIARADEIDNRHALILIFVRHSDDKAQIGFDEFGTRFAVALANARREPNFLSCRERLRRGHVFEIAMQGIFGNDCRRQGNHLIEGE